MFCAIFVFELNASFHKKTEHIPMASYKKNLKQVREHLQNNETIVSSIDGHFESNGWLRNGILVATENRLIFFSDKLTGFDLESFPYTNISSYVLSKEILGQKIKFFASGNEVTINNITSENIKEFNNYINSNIGSQNNHNTEVHTESVASQLEKLATLLEKKLISEDEFLKMKSDISSNKSPNKVSIKNETTKQKTQDNQPLFDKKNTSSNKILKIVLLIFVVIPIFIIVVSAVFNDYEIKKYDNHITKYTTSNLNLRSTPKIADNIVKVLIPNNKLIIYDSIINDFIMVLDEDSTKIGWVSDQHLQMKPLNKKQLVAIKKKQEQKKVDKESGSNKKTKKNISTKEWYIGGTLHKSNIGEWKKATDNNKLATCGDFMATLDDTVSMTVLKKRAEELKDCIDTATKGLDSTDNLKVSEVAASCIVLLGY